MVRDLTGRLQKRKDSSFFGRYRVSTTDFNVVATWNFTSVGIGLMVKSNDPEDIILFSFDGQVVHGSLDPTFPSEAIMFDNRFQDKVWFKRKSPGDPVEVYVYAWRHMA